MGNRYTKRNSTSPTIREMSSKTTTRYHLKSVRMADIKNQEPDFPGERTHLPMLETRARSLVWEDSTCLGGMKPMSHNYRSPRALEPMLCNERGHHDEMLKHRNEE